MAKSTKPVSEDLIKSIEKSENTATKVEKVQEEIKATVSTGGSPLTFRRGDSTPVGTIADGTVVNVVKKSAKKMVINGDNKTMTEIRYNGNNGYVVQDYLRF